jgi:hypothetical protein
VICASSAFEGGEVRWAIAALLNKTRASIRLVNFMVLLE